MAGTIAVHQCLFCPQTFGSAVEKDDHILEHFAQETCTDCDQHLIRIGSSLYTLHNAVTCIKRESNLDVSIANESRIESINQNHDDGDLNAISTAHDTQMDIKDEPVPRDEAQFILDSIENCEKSTGQNYVEDEFADQHMEMKIECEEYCVSEQVTNSMELNDTNSDSSQVFQSQTHSTVSQKTLDDHAQPYTQPKKRGRPKKNAPLETNSQNQSHLQTASIELDQVKSNPNHKHKCDVCHKRFQSNSKLKNHKLYKHSVVPRVKCQICNKTYQNRENLRKHFRYNHTTQLKYKCDDCGTIFLSQQNLDKHVPNCKRVKERVPCDICGKIMNAESMAGHKQSKHSSIENWSVDFDVYQCDICQRFIRTKHALRQHMVKLHDSSRQKFKCEYCPCTFLRESTLKSHLNHRKCRKKLRESHMCDICGKTFADIKKHKYKRHNIIEGHHCTHCKNVFSSAIGLKNHERNCGKLSKFECFLCHRTYGTKFAMLTHFRLLHVPNRNKFKCQQCKIYCRCKLEMEMHMYQIHWSTHNFVCGTCGKTFKSRGNLRSHSESHRQDRPYQCTFDGCEKSFKTTSNRSSHLRIHRGEQKFRCRIDGCTEQFGGVAGYKNHKFRVHGVPITNFV